MRVYYWSHTKFANRLRSVFGISRPPTFATAEGWDDYEKTAKSASSIGYKVVEGLDSLQNVWLYVPDKIDAVGCYFSNIKNDSHILRTRTNRGTWSDLVSRIPDALMLSVIDFVEKECFWMNVICSEEENNKLISDYKNQSYFMRKFFPIFVPDTVRGENGIAWLDFQISSSATTKRQIERHKYQKIKAAYAFAKGRFQTFDSYKESGLDLLYEDKDISFDLSVDRSVAYERVRELDAQFEKELTKHCNSIVKYRDYLWT